jgi:hypothetical protein
VCVCLFPVYSHICRRYSSFDMSRRMRNEVHIHTGRQRNCVILVVAIVVIVVTLGALAGILIWRWPGSNGHHEIVAAMAEIKSAIVAAADVKKPLFNAQSSAPILVIAGKSLEAAKPPSRPVRLPRVVSPPPILTPTCSPSHIAFSNLLDCPTRLGGSSNSLKPVCRKEYAWELSQESTSPSVIPNVLPCPASRLTIVGGPALTFTTNRTKTLRNTLLVGSGSLVITNVGRCTSRLASLLLVLERPPLRIATVGVVRTDIKAGCTASDAAMVCDTGDHNLLAPIPRQYNAHGLTTLSLDTTVLANGSDCNGATTFPVDFAFLIPPEYTTSITDNPDGYRISALATYSSCCGNFPEATSCVFDIDCDGASESISTITTVSPFFTIALAICENRCACISSRTLFEELLLTPHECEIAVNISNRDATEFCESNVATQRSPVSLPSSEGYCCSPTAGTKQLQSVCNNAAFNVTGRLRVAPVRTTCVSYDGTNLVRVGTLVEASVQCTFTVTSCDSFACIAGDSGDVQMTETLVCPVRACMASCQLCTTYNTCVPTAC